MLEVTAAQMKQLEDRANTNGLSYEDMMENAGQAAARILLECMPDFRTAAILCGKGNNGGDGFVVARKLFEAGRRVCIILTDGAPAGPGAAYTNYMRARRLSIPLFSLDEILGQEERLIQNTNVIVDAVTGTGFHGELRKNAKMAAQIANRANGFVMALDVPSGVEADTGRAAEGAVRANLTVTFHARKPCHRLCKDLCGDVRVARIGI